MGLEREERMDVPFVRDLLLAVEIADLVEGVETGTEAAMKTEHGVLDECGHREVVEEVGEVAPDIGTAILPHAFVIEPIAIGQPFAPYTCVTCRDSWFPLVIVILSLYRTFRQIIKVTVSTE
jgi:hypothetical protein